MVALEQTASPRAAPAVPDAIPPAVRRRGGSPRRALAVSLIGAIALALFASRDLPGWADRLDDGRVAGMVRPLAAEWDSAMAALGLTRPHEALRAASRRLLDAAW